MWQHFWSILDKLGLLFIPESGHNGGSDQVVSIFSFYSDEQSLNPTSQQFLFLKNVMVITILIKMSVLGTPTVPSTLIFFLTRKEGNSN